MAHRSLSTLQLVGFAPSTASTLVSMLGDEGIPNDVRLVEDLTYQPWTTSRSGLVVLSMDPRSDLTKISNVIQDRTTWWEVAVCLSEEIKAYQPALLAQGAIKVFTHPEDELSQCRDELRELLNVLTVHGTDLLGLELADLIQLYGEKRVPKTIRINAQGVIGSMYLRDGLIVHAETMDETTGMEAFSRLFGAKSPELRVHNGCLTSQESVNMPVMSVMLEGARVNDEDSVSSPMHTPLPTMNSPAPLNPKARMPTNDDMSGALDDILGDFDQPSSSKKQSSPNGSGGKSSPVSVPVSLEDLEDDLDLGDDDLDDFDELD